MLTSKKISIVIVCYNDAGSVHEMLKRVRGVMDGITRNYEIIYVNDKSPDNAYDVLKVEAAKDKRLIVINHSRNFGGQAAYTSGMKYATGEAAILLDGDLQDPPELFSEFVKKWLDGHDIVYGIRKRREGTTIRRIGYKIFYRIFKHLSYINIPLDAGDFSLISRRALDVINGFPEVDRYIRGIRAYVGFKTIGIPYVRQDRFAGESNNSFVWLIRWAKKIIFSFSYQPLEWIAYLAVLVTVLAGLGIVFYIGLAFFLEPPSGFLTLLIAVLFLGAIQLISLAVIAEYLGRIFEEVKHRPVGIVDEVINDYKNIKP
ncbi:MAG: hypothetical protein A2934_03540 [Candidatus Sungbacteria bacterium RIFCSPLOWO2_01_FULL_47_10]|uniref:Glycosyltransferase 2-like domain-containing protein n=1 Tax=Candidatus Sungbacteria bacterium RIFCSPLOWO2_01_FULL_47_10 TaxID=1802276 RepID=A0A1G2L403_9BACT|nr:MAG: hypothetical protein A2934_03540 [Candidatus Sungbacteria bacterium RIFCSPLOWO2_01_FULL_47_10]